MNVDEKKTTAGATHRGQTYYFCAPACRDKFVKAYVVPDTGTKKPPR
jgi:YHS domain-containing protein